MTESRFRERRSAHRDETATEAEAPAPVEPAVSAPPTPSTAAESETIEEAGRIPPAPAIPEETEPASESPAEPPPGSAEIAAYLDQLERMEPPEPSFLELIGPHIEEALRYLGELPITPDGERRVMPRWAKREIDLLGLLEQRTRGNLPVEEQEYLQQALDHLRTTYLKVSR